jgi:hypothetical protein
MAIYRSPAAILCLNRQQRDEVLCLYGPDTTGCFSQPVKEEFTTCLMRPGSLVTELSV